MNVILFQLKMLVASDSHFQLKKNNINVPNAFGDMKKFTSYYIMLSKQWTSIVLFQLNFSAGSIEHCSESVSFLATPIADVKRTYILYFPLLGPPL